LFHYGSHESRYIDHMVKLYNANKPIIEKIKSNTINILSVIYNYIYFPTYSNNLKTISTYLGFNWSKSLQSGLQSIVWRTYWERNKNQVLKQDLINYNYNDCLALKLLTDKIIVNQKQNSADQSLLPNLMNSTKDVVKQYPYLFKPNDFVFEELDKINKCAYLNYQRSKIYFRTNSTVKKSLKRKLQQKPTEKKLKDLKVNKTILCQYPYSCILCGAGHPKKHIEFSRIIYDLKLLNTGIKRWIVRYKSAYYKCQKCKKIFVPDSFANFVPRKYGKILCSYIIYLLIYQNLSKTKISEHLYELFGYSIQRGSLHNIKINSSVSLNLLILKF